MISRPTVQFRPVLPVKQVTLSRACLLILSLAVAGTALVVYAVVGDHAQPAAVLGVSILWLAAAVFFARDRILERSEASASRIQLANAGISEEVHLLRSQVACLRQDLATLLTNQSRLYHRVDQIGTDLGVDEAAEAEERVSAIRQQVRGVPTLYPRSPNRRPSPTSR